MASSSDRRSSDGGASSSVAVEQHLVTEGATGVAVARADRLDVRANAGSVRVLHAEQVFLPQAEVPRATHQLPPRVPDFIGREALLEEIEGALGKGLCISAIQGMGGIGKTQLALALAHRIKQDFPDGQIFLDLRSESDQPLSAQEAMTWVVRSLAGHADVGAAPELITAHYHHCLTGKRVLLLMDNALDAEQVAPLMPLEGSALVVTSRRKFQLPGLKSFELDVLSRGESEHLLRELCPRLGAEAGPIAERCGCLPLALRLIGSLLATRADLSPHDVLERLTRGLSRSELQPIKVCFDASYEALRRTERRLWVRLAIFPGMITPEAARAVWAVDAARARDLLGEFTRRSLVIFEPGRDRYRLHDLMRQYAAERLSKRKRRACELGFAEHYLEFIKALGNQHLAHNGRSQREAVMLYESEREQIALAHGLVVERSAHKGRTLILCVEFDEAAAGLRMRRQDRTEYLKWAQAAYDAWRRTTIWGRFWAFWKHSWPARSAVMLVRRLNSVAHAFERVGQPFDARETLEQISKLRGWGLREARLEATLEIARIHLDEGNPKRAEHFCALARAESNALPDIERRILAMSASARDMAGDYRGALEIAESVLSKLRGTATIEEGDALLDVAEYQAKLGERDSARANRTRALEIARERNDDELRQWAERALTRIEDRSTDVTTVERTIEADIEEARATLDPEREVLALRRRMRVLAKREQWQEAESYLESAVALTLRHHLLWHGIRLVADAEAVLGPSAVEVARAALEREIAEHFDEIRTRDLCDVFYQVVDDRRADDFWWHLSLRALERLRREGDAEAENQIITWQGRYLVRKGSVVSGRKLLTTATVRARQARRTQEEFMLIEWIIATFSQPPPDPDLADRCFRDLWMLLQDGGRLEPLRAMARILRAFDATNQRLPVASVYVSAAESVALKAVERAPSPDAVQFLAALAQRPGLTGEERVMRAQRAQTAAAVLQDGNEIASVTSAMASALAEAGRSNEARALFDDAIASARGVDNPEIEFALMFAFGRCFESDTSASHASYRRALAIRDVPLRYRRSVHFALIRSLLSVDATSGGAAAAAVEALSQCAAARPEMEFASITAKLEFVMLEAEALERLERIGDAIALCEAALPSARIAPDVHWDLRRALGALHEKAGNYDGALTNLEACLALAEKYLPRSVEFSAQWLREFRERTLHVQGQAPAKGS